MLGPVLHAICRQLQQFLLISGASTVAMSTAVNTSMSLAMQIHTLHQSWQGDRRFMTCHGHLQ